MSKKFKQGLFYWGSTAFWSGIKCLKGCFIPKQYRKFTSFLDLYSKHDYLCQLWVPVVSKQVRKKKRSRIYSTLKRASFQNDTSSYRKPLLTGNYPSEQCIEFKSTRYCFSVIKFEEDTIIAGNSLPGQFVTVMHKVVHTTCTVINAASNVNRPNSFFSQN